MYFLVQDEAIELDTIDLKQLKGSGSPMKMFLMIIKYVQNNLNFVTKIRKVVSH